MKNIVFFVLLLSSFAANAAITLTFTQKDMIAKHSLQQFWGKVELPDGTYLKPKNEIERTTLPITKSITNKVIDVAESSALSAWCELPWQENFERMVHHYKHQKSLNKTQQAFISFLHGMTYTLIKKKLEKKVCAPEYKRKIHELSKLVGQHY